MTTYPTAAIADASLRVGVPVRTAPAALHPLFAGAVFSGPAMPVTHLGSVDVILQAIDDAPAGFVLVVDNAGRDDEACVGDLMLLEAREAGAAGVVVWGRHRDTAQLHQIGLPIHSLGAFPFGPRRVPPAGAPMYSAYLDGASVAPGDHVFADDDGILFVAADRLDDVLEAATVILQTEGAQAERMRAGTSLREQLDFSAYRARQTDDPSLTLRRHLAERGGAIEV
ncbi:RraA family protein [Herbiconiux daphne]|uniref:Putative 4-hydroxy-4-methyl-2-oxoglutarate aldolase n=1 Tax=Herbiconiux daphne TaxID=2970914 RepID=A0ABT2H7S4_9MICO|nr:RraA family protein [Herbiconiux daphne]MCS5736015.1 RraA family protein [Herbiconiux daphne]